MPMMLEQARRKCRCFASGPDHVLFFESALLTMTNLIGHVMGEAARLRPRIGDGEPLSIHPRTPRVHPMPFMHFSAGKFDWSGEPIVADTPNSKAKRRLFGRAAVAGMARTNDLLLRPVAHPRVNEFAQTVLSHGLNPLYFSGRCAGSGWSQFINSSHVSGAGTFGSYFGLEQRQIGHSSTHGFNPRSLSWQKWSQRFISLL